MEKQRLVRRAVLCLLVAALAGCSSKPQLMPTPNLYASGIKDPFPDVPPDMQNNRIEVLYVTDRVPEPNSTPQHVTYGFKRSRSAAVGVATIQIGDANLSWDQLAKASRTNKRDVKLPLTVIDTHEIVRLPPTPKTLIELPSPAERAQHPTSTPSTLQVEVEAEEERAKNALRERLARTPRKDVYLFVHGYNNNFDDSVETIGELWHFMGRQGVPVAYSWPAGRGGLLRGYTYDRESSEFTVYHLKETIRMIASVPEVQKIHVLAHSRGTDVATSALRELHLEFQGGGKDTRKELKLGTLILAAPDLDVEVVIQRMVTARLGRVPEMFTLYCCKKDNALGISTWLFGSGERLGKLTAEIFAPEELEAVRARKQLQIVDARIADPGPFGHSYFHANPAVSSDVILAMRYQAFPGPERPLLADPKGFWYIDDKYPKESLAPTTAPVNAAAAAP